jgi:hypothetical protein
VTARWSSTASAWRRGLPREPFVRLGGPVRSDHHSIAGDNDSELRDAYCGKPVSFLVIGSHKHLSSTSRSCVSLPSGLDSSRAQRRRLRFAHVQSMARGSVTPCFVRHMSCHRREWSETVLRLPIHHRPWPTSLEQCVGTECSSTTARTMRRVAQILPTKARRRCESMSLRDPHDRAASEMSNCSGAL